MTKEDLEEANEREDRDDWFKDKGCTKLSDVSTRKAKYCRS